MTRRLERENVEWCFGCRLLPPPEFKQEDVKHAYRFGIRPEELEGINPRLKNYLLLYNGRPTERKKYRIQKEIEKYQRDITDTGSSEVQGLLR